MSTPLHNELAAALAELNEQQGRLNDALAPISAPGDRPYPWRTDCLVVTLAGVPRCADRAPRGSANEGATAGVGNADSLTYQRITAPPALGRPCRKIDPSSSLSRPKVLVRAIPLRYNNPIYRDKGFTRKSALARLQSAKGTAVSEDRLVEATVDGQGRITALRLNGRRWRDMAPKELAARIVEVIGRAQDQAAQQTAEMVAGLMPAGMDPESLRNPDLDAMFATAREELAKGWQQ